jgi:hypothetical protein
MVLGTVRIAQCVRDPGGGVMKDRLRRLTGYGPRRFRPSLLQTSLTTQHLGQPIEGVRVIPGQLRDRAKASFGFGEPARRLMPVGFVPERDNLLRHGPITLSIRCAPRMADPVAWGNSRGGTPQ